MFRFLSNPINWVSATIVFFGFGGVEDDIRTWARWMDTAYTYWGSKEANLVEILSGDTGRLILVGSGVSLMLVANKVPQKLYGLLPFRKRPDDVFAELRKLRAEGVKLRNNIQSQVRSVGDLKTWITQATAWRGNVAKQVEKVNNAWAGYIEILNTLDDSHIPIAYTLPGVVEGHEHQKWADIQHQRLARLEEFISDPKGNPPTSVQQARPSHDSVSMNEAAQRVYTVARQEKHPWSIVVESKAQSPDDILNSMAIQIAAKKTIYGKKSPSLQTENISRDDVSATTFIEGATKLQGMFNTSVYFTDLAIKRVDLEDLVAQIQFDSGFSQ